MSDPNPLPFPSVPGQPMSDEELVSRLDYERNNSATIGSSELAQEQANLIRYYEGRLPGKPVQEGTSGVVDRTAAEHVDWTVPDLRRALTSGQKIVNFEPEAPEAVQWADEVNDYMNRAFFKDNSGMDIVHDMAHEGCVQRYGAIRVDWEDPPAGVKEVYEGLNVPQAQEVVSREDDGELEVVEAEEIPADNVVTHPGGVAYDVAIRRRRQWGTLKFAAIPNEEFLINQRAKSIPEAKYVAHRPRKTRSELLEMFPDFAAEIEMLSDTRADDIQKDQRRYQRFRNQSEKWNYSQSNLGHASDEFEFLDEYVRVDFDGDGFTELRRVQRVGRTIFSNDEVKRAPFAMWSPYRVPHSAIGKGVVDKVSDIQEIASAQWRNVLNAQALTVAPRMEVTGDKTTIKAALSYRAGSVIPTKEPGSVRPIPVQDMTGPVMAMMEYTQQRGESRTGVSRQTQGLESEVMNQTLGGTMLLQDAGAKQVYNMALNLATAFCEIFDIAYELARERSADDKPRMMLRNGQWVAVSPAMWPAPEDFSASVHVGQGAGSRRAELANQQTLLALQEKIVTQQGFSGPYVGTRELWNTLDEICETMGFGTTEEYFKNPSGDPQKQQQLETPPDPSQSPEAQAAMAIAQLEREKVQTDRMKAETDAANDRYKIEADNANKAEDRALKLRIAELEFQLEVAKLQGGDVAPDTLEGGIDAT